MPIFTATKKKVKQQPDYRPTDERIADLELSLVNLRAELPLLVKEAVTDYYNTQFKAMTMGAGR